MKEKVLTIAAILAAVAIIVLSVPASEVEADEANPFTVVDGTDYPTLGDALTNVSDAGTIQLNANATFIDDNKLTINKSVTLDLNGFTLTTSTTLTVAKDMTLTIEDSSAEGTGLFSTSKQYAIDVYGTLKLESGNMESSADTIIRVYGSGAFEMTGGTIEGSKGQGVFVMGSATITAGTIGATETANSSYAALKLSTNGSTTIGTADTSPYLYSLNPNGLDVMMVSGIVGKVNGDFGADSQFNGGKFESSPENYLPSKYAAQSDSSGYWIVVPFTDDHAKASITKSDGTVNLYPTLISAGKAMESGDTLTLLEDYKGDRVVTVNIYYGTIDLNGCDVTCTKTGTSGYGINIAKGTGTYDSSNTNTIVITSDTESTIEASYPVSISSGNSKNSVYIKVEGSVTLESTEGRDLIKLGSGSSALFTENIRDCFVNGGFVATVNDVEYVYGTASAALRNSDDGYAKMLNNYTGNIVLDSPRTYTLDLDGYTVTYNTTIDPDNLQAAVTIYGETTLTIKNGKIETNVSGIAPGLVHSGGTIENNVSLTLDNVQLTADNMYAIYSNGTCENIQVKVINGSSVVCTSSTGVGIYFPAEGSLTITDSTVKGGTGIEVRKGSLEISGDKTVIEATASKYSVHETPDGGGSTVLGAAVAISPYSGIDSMSVDISGGTFTGAVAFAQAHADEETVMPTFDFSISGGSFTSTGKDVNSDTYPAIVTEKGEVTGKFISGGSFSDESVLTYVVDGKGLIENGTMFDVTNMYTITYTFNEEEYTEKVPEGFAPSTDVLPELPAGCVYDFGTWDKTAAVTEDTSVTVTAEITELSVTISVSVEDGTTSLRAIVESSASGETTYAWSNDEDKETITVTESGEYTVTVTLTTTSGEISVSGIATAKTTYTATENGGSSTTTENSDGSKTETVVEEDGSMSETTEKSEITTSGNTVTTVITTGKDSSGKEIESTASATIDATRSQTGDIVDIPVGDVTVAVESIKSANDKTVSISIGNNDKVTIAPEAMEAISSSEAKLEISNDTAKIVADKTVANTLASDQSVSISVSSAEHADLNDTQQQSVPENSTIIELSATVGSDPIHELGGTVEVHMKYSLPEGIDADDVIVFYVDDEGVLHDMVTKFADNIITFFTNHFSYYFVGDRSMIVPEDPEPSPGEDDTPVVVPPVDDEDDYVPLPPAIVEEPGSSDDDTVKIVACAAAAVVAALMAAFLIISRRD